jgi:beta-glucanase (GH16 family)
MTAVLVIAVALVGAAAGVGAVSSLDDGNRQPSTSTASPATNRIPVYEDNFDGTKLNTSKWTPYHSPGNGDNGLRRPSAFSLDGKGTLVVTARMVGGRIVSGGMASRRTVTYGRFEVRVRTEPDPAGTMSGVVLTWPQSGNWPTDGENNIYETGAGVNSRSPFHSFVHYGANNRQYVITQRADGAQWHTMVMDWRPSAITFYRDGSFVGQVTNRAAIPDVPHFLAIQLDATRTRPLTRPVRMYVDYVRIYP